MAKRIKTAVNNKKVYLLASLISGFLVSLVFFRYLPKTTNAQVPEPYVQCNQKDAPEWNSLRPYQASPCNIPIDESEQALLCGNDLVVRDTFTVDASQGQCPDTPCPGPVTCHFEIPRDFDISINAFDSELPIAGQTELVPGGHPAPNGYTTAWNLSNFESHVPPDILDSSYKEFTDYYKDYQNWRGHSCAEIPIPIIFKTVLVCFENPLIPNYWAYLFPYIPFSSTEDRIGKTHASDIFVVSADFTVQDLQTAWKAKLSDPRNENTLNQEGVLYFPHMEETTQLSNFLQSTYVSKDSLVSQEGQSIDQSQVEEPTIGAQCRILDIRSNPGDQLFGEQIDTKSGKGTGAPAADVSYTAVFDCVMQNVCVVSGVAGMPCPYCIPEGQCTKTGTFSSTIDTYTPLVDDLWARTVAGNSSVFKKFYPKVGVDEAPVDKIKDTPTESSVEHVSSIQVLSMPAKLFFPHFGGIYDYFLKGIQKAVRPKDFPADTVQLPDDTPIYDPDTINEYVSWYLNGSIFRAEQDPISDKSETDINKLTTNTGPLNRLLPQQINWKAEVPGPDETMELGKIAQIENAGETRHNQIAGCTAGINIFIPFINKMITIGGFPVACDAKKEASQNQEGTITNGEIQCKSSMPELSSSSSCKLTQTTINGIKIPPTMKKIFEAAAETYNIPADLVAGVMFAEGGFEPRVTSTSCYGPYTEENVQQATLCEFANCNPDEYNPPCNYDSTQGPASCINGGTHFGPFQQCPNGYNPCNIYDAIMNAAKSLANAKASSYSGLTSCLGVNISNPQSGGSDCQKTSWSCEDVITALSNWEGSCNPGGHACNALKIYGACNSQCP